MKELGRAQHRQGPSIRPQRPAQKAPGTFPSLWGSKNPRSIGQDPQGCWLTAKERAPRGLRLLSTLPAAPCPARCCQASWPLSDYWPSRSENRRGQILFAEHLTSAELPGLGRRAERRARDELRVVLPGQEVLLHPPGGVLGDGNWLKVQPCQQARGAAMGREGKK